jgi:hypothetical protein
MKYDRTLTLNHIKSIQHPACMIDFNDLIANEGFNGNLPIFEKGIDVLDLDCVERALAIAAGRNLLKSMDCAFVIKDDTQEEMLLVELKFNYQNVRNLLRNELVEKVQGSLSALGNSFPISQTYIFIFQSNLKQQAINKLFRMYPRVPSPFIAYDIFELKSQYFDK